MRIEVIMILLLIKLQIEMTTQVIEGQLQVIVFLSKVTVLHGNVRNRMLWLDQVQK